MIELKNKELERYVLFSTNKNTLSLDDLLSIKKVTLDAVTIDNKYDPIYFADLEYFRNLESLYIANTKITEEDLKYIYTLPNLKLLSLSNCTINTLDNINYLKSLEKLYLSNLKYSNIDSIGNIELLKELKITGTDIISIDFIKELKYLTALDISYSSISNLDIIKELISLEKLSIRDIQNINIEEILLLPNLKEIYISDDKVESIKANFLSKGIKVYGSSIIAGDDVDV